MTFLMSCRRDKSPHCHCHSPASSWERACQVTCNQLLTMVITSTCFPGGGHWKDPLPTSPRSSCCCFSHCMRFGLNVKLNRGHLPFCASLAFVAWPLCWPGEEMGELLGELPCTALTKQNRSGKRLSTSSEVIMSEGVRQRGSCQTRRAKMMSKRHCQPYLVRSVRALRGTETWVFGFRSQF